MKASKLVTAPAKHLYRHLFLYVFMGVQVIFLVWAVTALSAAPTVPAHCLDAHGNVNIFSGDDCANAAGGDVGSGIAAGLIFGLWVGTDVILGFGRLVYVLSRRRKPA